MNTLCPNTNGRQRQSFYLKAFCGICCGRAAIPDHLAIEDSVVGFVRMYRTALCPLFALAGLACFWNKARYRHPHLGTGCFLATTERAERIYKGLAK